MTRREQPGMGRAGIWPELLDANDDEWPDWRRPGGRCC